MNLAQAIQAAYDADEAFEAAVKAHGYKSRWSLDCSDAKEPALRAACWAKRDADKAMQAAFDESRRIAR